MDGSGDFLRLASQLDRMKGSLGEHDAPAMHLRAGMISKAKELIDALITPEQHTLQRGINATEMFAIRTIMKLGVLEALPDNGAVVSLEALCAKLGAEHSLLERLLRLLVGTRFINQDANGYSHTRFSRAYLGLPGDFFVGITHDIGLASLVHYPEYLDAHPELSLKEPASVTHNVYTWTHGSEGENFWQVLAKNPETLARFQKGLSMLGPLNRVTGYYPFGELRNQDDRIALVDVGAGPGTCIVEILNAHPELKPEQVVLQDRPEVIEMAKQNSELAHGVLKMAHDFFTPQPVKDARAYFMRYITHDYSDEVVVGILKNLVVAMAPDSRVLICDSVVPERVDDMSILSSMVDMFVLTMGGKERTARMFESVLDEAGLKLEKIHGSPASATAILEAALK